MTTRRRVTRLLATGIAAGVLAPGRMVRAQAAGPVRIGCLSDLSSAYADVSGPALVQAVRMAAADFGPVLGAPADVVAADCQLKPDVASTIAREWWDVGGVDAVIDMPSTPVALAVMQISAEKRKIVLATSPGSSDVTGKACSPFTTHWAYDSYAMAHTLGTALMKQGGDSWFFIAADYAFGAALVSDATKVIETAGGRVIGVARAPLNTRDFSSYLLQAQSSGAKVVVFANAGADAVNGIKQAAEFGLGRDGQSIGGMVLMDTDVHAIGLEAAAGTLLATAFYWDRTEASRAWSKRFMAAVGRMPTMLQAAAYSQATHYLRAVQQAGSKDADLVMAKMREIPVRDFFADDGVVRKDGRMVHDMYLAQVKTPAQSTGPWDQYRIVATVPAAEAFRPLADGGCRLV